MGQRFGEGDIGWLKQAQPGTVENAVLVIYDSTGKHASTVAIRTQDVPVGSMYVGHDVFVYVDNPLGPTTGYGHYIEVHMKAIAAAGSIAQGIELDLINEKPPVETNPYSPNLPGLTELLRLATIGQNGPSPYPGSHAMVIGGGGPGFLRGIIFAFQEAIQEVLAFATGHRLTWWCPPSRDAPAQPGPHIRSDCTDPAQAMRMIFFDGGLALQTPDGINRHIFWTDGTVQSNVVPPFVPATLPPVPIDVAPPPSLPSIPSDSIPGTDPTGGSLPSDSMPGTDPVGPTLPPDVIPGTDPIPTSAWITIISPPQLAGPYASRDVLIAACKAYSSSQAFDLDGDGFIFGFGPAIHLISTR